jgi:hypothetical protein
MAKSTDAQRFKKMFDLSQDESATPKEREAATRKWRDWLRKNNKNSHDISAILAQAERDDEATHPPQPDPRDSGQAPDDPDFNPATAVEDFVSLYVTQLEPVRVVFTLWIVATHVYTRFRIAPRILLTSEDPESGKSVSLEVARGLMFRANEEAAATDAAIRDHLGPGPGSVALDETDLIGAAHRLLLALWNRGHAKGESSNYSLMIGGRKRTISLFAPVIAAGLGRILGEAQLTRTFVLRMLKCDETNRPALEWYGPSDEDGEDSEAARKDRFATLYGYLRHWAANQKLNLRPRLPDGFMGRDADNARSVLAVAEACGGTWPRRACEALLMLNRERTADQPKILILRHGLLIFDQLEAEELERGHFNHELHRLGAPELDWTRYRGVSGLDSNPHPISVGEQGRLLGKSGVKSHPTWPKGVPKSQRQPGDCKRLLRRGDFEAALSKAEAKPASVKSLGAPRRK